MVLGLFLEEWQSRGEDPSQPGSKTGALFSKTAIPRPHILSRGEAWAKSIPEAGKQVRTDKRKEQCCIIPKMAQDSEVSPITKCISCF